MHMREVLTTDVRVNETLDLQIVNSDGSRETVRIQLLSKSGQMARLRIDAPESVHIPRGIRAREPAAG